MKQSKEDVSKFLKDGLSTPRGKAILFFVFYFFFFVIVISLIAPGKNSSSTSDEKPSKIDYSLIDTNNYHFHYQDDLGGSSTIYDGDRNGSNFLFTVNNLDTFYSGESVFFKKDVTTNQYVMVNSPYLFPELKDLDNIKKIVKKATYISTKKDSSSIKVTYQISTTTLVSMFENKEVDLDDVPNTVLLTLDKSSKLYKIEYDFNSYSIYKGLGTYRSSLEYSNFSNVGEIEISS